MAPDHALFNTLLESENHSFIFWSQEKKHSALAAQSLAGWAQ